jgi:hypothetical protein
VTTPDLRAQIVGEIYPALERSMPNEELLAIVGSWRTLSDERIFLLLREYNADRPTCIGRNDIASPHERTRRWSE